MRWRRAVFSTAEPWGAQPLLLLSRRPRPDGRGRLTTWTTVPPQALDLTQIPKDLETPKYTVVRAGRGYEIRRMEPFLVADAPMGAGAGARAARARAPRKRGGGRGGGWGAEGCVPVSARPARCPRRFQTGLRPALP